MRAETAIFAMLAGALSTGLAFAGITAEQALMFRQMSDVQVSPGGDRVVFTVTEPPLHVHEIRHVWVVNNRNFEALQLTNSAASEYSPRWSPDGRKVAFISDRDGSARIYVVSAAGGEAAAITPPGEPVRTFEWSPDGQQIAFIAVEPRDPSRDSAQRGPYAFGSRDQLPRLRIVNVATREVRRLLESWQVSEVQWLPKGQGLVIRGSDHPDAQERLTDRICIVSLADGSLRQVATPKGWYLSLNVSPDGNSVAYRAPELDGPIPHDLFIQPLRGGPAINLTASRINNRVDAFVWKSGNSFLALAQHGFANRLYEISGDGPPQKVDAAADDTIAFDERAGVLAFVRQTWTERPELWISVDGSPPRQATNLNKEWRDIRLIAPRYLHVRSFDGTEIEAALLVPANYGKGAMLPTVVMLHGGPAGRWGNPPHAWGYPTGQVLAARGYAVLYPNVRGSSGYGQKFMEMNRGDLGGGDFKDVMAAVDYIIHDGIADPDRLGVAGWSYGGYLTMWAVTQTNRFKAAVAGAGWSNWMNEFGTDDVPHIDAWWFPEPYKHPEAFVRSSPIAHVANVRTPTLMLHGDADRRDPLGESQQFYRALKWLGIETRLFVYPGEGHPFRQGPHMIDSIDRTLAWFDSHMKHQALHQETDFYVGDKAGK